MAKPASASDVATTASPEPEHVAEAEAVVPAVVVEAVAVGVPVEAPEAVAVVPVLKAPEAEAVTKKIYKNNSVSNRRFT